MKPTGHSVLCGCLLLCLFANAVVAQRITFDAIPEGWIVKDKPFTKSAVFQIQENPSDPTHRWLSLLSDQASGSLISGDPVQVDLKKTPILRWRWRATKLPPGADGRDPDKDDQAIGIYISSGNRFKQQSIAYRWETKTPAGSEGTVQYARIITVRWFAIRDESHADGETFFIEERNLAEDFKNAFGKIPERIGIGLSCNSQYTGTSSEAQLDWIEFVEAPAVVSNQPPAVPSEKSGK